MGLNKAFPRTSHGLTRLLLVEIIIPFLVLGWLDRRVNSFLLYTPQSKVDPNATILFQIGERIRQALLNLDVLQAALSESKKERVYLHITGLVVPCQLSRTFGSDGLLLPGPESLPPLRATKLDREWKHDSASRQSFQPLSCLVIGSVGWPEIENAVLLIIEELDGQAERIGVASFSLQTQEKRKSWSFALTEGI
ncbi:uncharacterized protein PAC_12881 [Phialocephala subalpina]|uniref:Uncharacterized protein n=1 Tax=Phialocephala subalpina TaxID=576137 RepID=A0A1L7XD82_9HELO|nr:uncharacterized protein PAC_12881 [Phialocephala subalpina]